MSITGPITATITTTNGDYRTATVEGPNEVWNKFSVYLLSVHPENRDNFCEEFNSEYTALTLSREIGETLIATTSSDPENVVPNIHFTVASSIDVIADKIKVTLTPDLPADQTYTLHIIKYGTYFTWKCPNFAITCDSPTVDY